MVKPMCSARAKCVVAIWETAQSAVVRGTANPMLAPNAKNTNAAIMPMRWQTKPMLNLADFMGTGHHG